MRGWEGEGEACVYWAGIGREEGWKGEGGMSFACGMEGDGRGGQRGSSARSCSSPRRGCWTLCNTQRSRVRGWEGEGGWWLHFACGLGEGEESAGEGFKSPELFNPMAQEVLASMFAIVQHPQAKGEAGGRPEGGWGVLCGCGLGRGGARGGRAVQAHGSGGAG